MARVLLQFPEGLKAKAFEYAKKYAEEGNEVIISASPCFGACDLAIEEAKAVRADKIIHFGHNAFLKGKPSIEVEYVPYRVDIPLSSLSKAGGLLKEKGISSIALVSTVQHTHQIAEMKEILSRYVKVYTQRGYWAREEGQILGCDASAALTEAEAILYVGSGYFHPLAFADLKKRVFAFDPFSSILREVTEEVKKVEKKKLAMVMRAYNATTFAIILSTKPGQKREELANWALRELRKRGKEAFLFITNHVFPSALENINADVYVNTACPRLLDDYWGFRKPFLNIDMLANLFALWEKKELKPWFYWIGKKRE